MASLYSCTCILKTFICQGDFPFLHHCVVIPTIERCRERKGERGKRRREGESGREGEKERDNEGGKEKMGREKEREGEGDREKERRKGKGARKRHVDTQSEHIHWVC
jgi:hypothetical protein